MRPFSANVTGLLVLGVFGLAAASVSAETLHLRADSWMPYNGDPASERPGFVVEMAKAVFEPQGIVVDYQTMPWIDALGAVREGKIDGVIGAGSTETEGLVVPAESLGEPRVVLLVARGNPWIFENTMSLRSVRLGVIEGYTYWDGLDEYIKAGREPAVVTFKGETPLIDALTQLKDGKIDVLPELLTVFVWTAKGMGLSPSEFRVVHMHQNDPIYVAFASTPAGERYAKIFDEGVKKMRASGELEKLLKAYGMCDWK